MGSMMLFKSHSFINVAKLPVAGINAEVTGSCTIALSPCSHSYHSTLVSSFGDDGEGCGGWCIVLSSQDTSCRGHDVPQRFLLVALDPP